MMIFPCSLVCLLVVDGDGKLYMLHMWGGIEGECYTSLATVNRYVESSSTLSWQGEVRKT